MVLRFVAIAATKSLRPRLLGSMEISDHDKALLFVSARGSDKKPVLERLRASAQAALERLSSPRAGVTVMSSLPIDPFRALSRAPGYEVTVELRSVSAQGSFSETIHWLLSELRDRVDPLECAAVVGRDYVFKDCPPQPIRFQYLMRRRADFTHEAYSKRYAEVHSVFGLRTRGNEGYIQFHADPQASHDVARSAGCGRWDFDSVAQLDLRSLTRFLVMGPYNATLGGLEDETHFVDRAASSMFVSKIVASVR